MIEQTVNETLAALETAENYRRWIFDLAAPFLEGPILEVGAGRGTYTDLLATKGPVTALEPSKSLATILTQRYQGRPDVEVAVGTIETLAPHGEFGSAVMFNVLEHISDDGDALRGLHRGLAAGGTLTLWVPAFDLLYSRFDEMLGHCRRYRLRALVELVRQSSFQVLDARYVNAAGWFSWLLGARVLNRVPTSPRVISTLDRFAVPVMRAIERRVVPPFGQSIFLAARKPLSRAGAGARPGRGGAAAR
jgi:SAM-dependent methyltransferase